MCMQVYLSSNPKHIYIYLYVYFWTHTLQLKCEGGPYSLTLAGSGLEPCGHTMQSRKMKYSIQMFYLWAPSLDYALCGEHNASLKVPTSRSFISYLLDNISPDPTTCSHRGHRTEGNRKILKHTDFIIFWERTIKKYYQMVVYATYAI